MLSNFCFIKHENSHYIPISNLFIIESNIFFTTIFKLIKSTAK